MQELIVILSCISNIGCNNTIDTYSFYNPNKVQYIRDLDKYVNPEAKKYVPFLVCGVKKECVFNVYNGTTVNIGTENVKMSYSISF